MPPRQSGRGRSRELTVEMLNGRPLRSSLVFAGVGCVAMWCLSVLGRPSHGDHPMATMPQCGARAPARNRFEVLDARSARQPTRDATAVRRVYPYPDRVGTHGGRSDRPAETRNADRRRARRTGRTAGRARRVPLCAVAAAPRPPRPACTHAPPGLSPPQTRCLFDATPRAVRREIKRDLAARPRRIRSLA